MITKPYAIFDLDGTLIDSMPYWDMVCGDFLRSRGLYNEALFEILKPMTIKQTADYLRDTYGLALSEAEMSGSMYEIMRGHYLRDVRVKPGVSDYLRAMQRQHTRMCVASSSPIDLVELCLDTFELQQYFAFAISAEAVGKGKTEPDIYLEAAKRLGGMPSETIVFEDALGAGKTAKNTGFTLAAVYDETGKTEWDAFCRLADVVVTDWRTI